MKKNLGYSYLFFVLALMSCDNGDEQPHNATYIVPNGSTSNLDFVISTYKHPSGETDLNAYTFQADGHFQRDYTLKDEKIYLLRDGLIDVINASTLMLEASKEVSVSNGYDYNKIVVTDSKVYLLGYASGATVLHRFDRTSLADEGATVANNIPEVIDAIAVGDKLVIGSTDLYFIDAASAEVIQTVDLPANALYLLKGKENDIIVVHASKVSIVNSESYNLADLGDVGRVAARPAVDVARNAIIYPTFAVQPSVYRFNNLYEFNLNTMEIEEIVSDTFWFRMSFNSVQYDAQHDLILLAGLEYQESQTEGTGVLRILDRQGKSVADVYGFPNPLDVLIPSH